MVRIDSVSKNLQYLQLVLIKPNFLVKLYWFMKKFYIVNVRTSSTSLEGGWMVRIDSVSKNLKYLQLVMTKLNFVVKFYWFMKKF